MCPMRENRGRLAAEYGKAFELCHTGPPMRLEGAYGGVHWIDALMFDPAAAFLKVVPMLKERMVGLPESSQSAM